MEAWPYSSDIPSFGPFPRRFGRPGLARDAPCSSAARPASGRRRSSSWLWEHAARFGMQGDEIDVIANTAVIRNDFEPSA
jgi:hypothetical protein